MNKTKLKELSGIDIHDQDFGDVKLNVFPFYKGKVDLPEAFKRFEKNIESMMNHVPDANGIGPHYVTIDSKFFSDKGSLRREGVHIDGNFCAQEGVVSWAGISMRNGEIKCDFDIPYDIKIPTGEYVSSEKGGLLVASSLSGCSVWNKDYSCEIGEAGDLSRYEDDFKDDESIKLKKNKVYFMSSNTPHQSHLIEKGERRTLIRITLNHDYPNKLIA